MVATRSVFEHRLMINQVQEMFLSIINSQSLSTNLVGNERLGMQSLQLLKWCSIK